MSQSLQCICAISVPVDKLVQYGIATANTKLILLAMKIEWFKGLRWTDQIIQSLRVNFNLSHL